MPVLLFTGTFLLWLAANGRLSKYITLATTANAGAPSTGKAGSPSEQSGSLGGLPKLPDLLPHKHTMPDGSTDYGYDLDQLGDIGKAVWGKITQ